MSINDHRRRLDPPTRQRNTRRIVGHMYECTSCNTRYIVNAYRSSWPEPPTATGQCPCGHTRVFKSFCREKPGAPKPNRFTYRNFK